MSWKLVAGSWKRQSGSWKRSRVMTAGLVGLVGAGVVWLRCGPIPAALLDGVDTPSTVIVDRHGHVLYEALGKDGSRITPIDAARMPTLIDSTMFSLKSLRRSYSSTLRCRERYSVAFSIAMAT